LADMLFRNKEMQGMRKDLPSHEITLKNSQLSLKSQQ
jgi:hypothetical protein